VAAAFGVIGTVNAQTKWSGRPYAADSEAAESLWRGRGHSTPTLRQSLDKVATDTWGQLRPLKFNSTR
jgi:hypothetical protein